MRASRIRSKLHGLNNESASAVESSVIPPTNFLPSDARIQHVDVKQGAWRCDVGLAIFM
jgi:hypothetical protein